MNETDMLIILERIIWLMEKNRFVEARRLVEREVENLQGITEQKCKRKQVNKGYCKICENLNCNEHIKLEGVENGK